VAGFSAPSPAGTFCPAAAHLSRADLQCACRAAVLRAAWTHYIPRVHRSTYFLSGRTPWHCKHLHALARRLPAKRYHLLRHRHGQVRHTPPTLPAPSLPPPARHTTARSHTAAAPAVLRGTPPHLLRRLFGHAPLHTARHRSSNALSTFLALLPPLFVGLWTPSACHSCPHWKVDLGQIARVSPSFPPLVPASAPTSL